MQRDHGRAQRWIVLSVHSSDLLMTVSLFWQTQNKAAEALDSSQEKWSLQTPRLLAPPADTEPD